VTNPLPGDDVLRVCGYLEALCAENAADQAALLARGPGETTMAVLVVQLGKQVLQRLYSVQFGIHDDRPPNEAQAAAAAMRADPTVHMTRILTETLAALAPSADPAQTETIAHAVLRCRCLTDPGRRVSAGGGELSIGVAVMGRRVCP
jgi:hypothetical protein